MLISLLKSQRDGDKWKVSSCFLKQSKSNFTLERIRKFELLNSKSYCGNLGRCCIRHWAVWFLSLWCLLSADRSEHIGNECFQQVEIIVTVTVNCICSTIPLKKQREQTLQSLAKSYRCMYRIDSLFSDWWPYVHLHLLPFLLFFLNPNAAVVGQPTTTVPGSEHSRTGRGIGSICQWVIKISGISEEKEGKMCLKVRSALLFVNPGGSS